jgi:hypothetical protein
MDERYFKAFDTTKSDARVEEPLTEEDIEFYINLYDLYKGQIDKKLDEMEFLRTSNFSIANILKKNGIKV